MTTEEIRSSLRQGRWETTYSDGDGAEHEAIQIPWPEVTAILGKEHSGTYEDDDVLVMALMAADAPAWVRTAAGWTDEHGWGVYNL